MNVFWIESFLLAWIEVVSSSRTLIDTARQMYDAKAASGPAVLEPEEEKKLTGAYQAYSSSSSTFEALEKLSDPFGVGSYVPVWERLREGAS